jgi:hypothetical protein
VFYSQLTPKLPAHPPKKYTAVFFLHPKFLERNFSRRFFPPIQIHEPKFFHAEFLCQRKSKLAFFIQPNFHADVKSTVSSAPPPHGQLAQALEALRRLSAAGRFRDVTIAAERARSRLPRWPGPVTRVVCNRYSPRVPQAAGAALRTLHDPHNPHNPRRNPGTFAPAKRAFLAC